MKPTASGWERRMFKKNKVWMATDPAGKPLVYHNRVLIKYQLDQEHEYWVNPENIHEILPDFSNQKQKINPSLGQDPGFVLNDRTHESLPAESDDRTITVYTDGASSGNPGPAGIGVVLCYGAHKREISQFIGNTTNNVAELTAVLSALQNLTRKDLPVRIYTDSKYVHNLLMSGWKAKKNTELVSAIKKLMAQFSDLKLIKVKGHDGVIGNERADRLATAAIHAAARTGKQKPPENVSGG